MKNKFYTIGEVAKKAQISARTLRYYEKLGLIYPDLVGENSYRYYKEDTILKLSIIKYLKLMGFSLVEVKEQLGSENIALMIKRFDTILNKNNDQIGELILRKQIINDWKSLLEESTLVRDQKIEGVNLKYIKEKNFISYDMEFDFDYRSAILDLDFLNFVKENNNKISGAVMLYFDDINKRIKADSNKEFIRTKHIQKALAPLNDNLKFSVKSGLFASYYHYGPYENLIKSYQKILEWEKTSTYKLKGPLIERFIIDYWVSLDSNNYITELIMPIENK